MGKPKTSSRHLALKSAMIDNEKLVGTALYKSTAELAQEYGVTPTTIYQLRHRLHLGPTAFTKSNPQTPKSSILLPAATTTEGLLKILEDEPLLTATDRLKILARLIRTGAPAIKITAIKTYEDLTRVTTDHVGPPPPLTEDEATARLARLLMATGKKIADAAYDVAFGDIDATTGPETTLQPNPPTPPSDAPLAAEPVPDLPTKVEEALGGPPPSNGESSGPPVQPV